MISTMIEKAEIILYLIQQMFSLPNWKQTAYS